MKQTTIYNAIAGLQPRGWGFVRREEWEAGNADLHYASTLWPGLQDYAAVLKADFKTNEVHVYPVHVRSRVESPGDAPPAAQAAMVVKVTSRTSAKALSEALDSELKALEAIFHVSGFDKPKKLTPR